MWIIFRGVYQSVSLAGFRSSVCKNQPGPPANETDKRRIADYLELRNR